VYKEILLPDDVRVHAQWAQNRETLWNLAQATDPGKRARYGHEWVMALPDELKAADRQSLARRFATTLVERYGGAVDLTIHEPRPQGDERNHHAHLLVTARKVEAGGFGERTDYNQPWKVLEPQGKPSALKQWQALRVTWIGYTNEALNAAGLSVRLQTSHIDEFGLRIPTKPGWSRAVEALVRAGQDSVVANAELKRYEYELRRRELEIKALENETRLDRLRAERTAWSQPSAQAIDHAPIRPAAAESPAPVTAMPVDFAGWVVWRAQQNFDPLAEEKRALEAVRQLRAERPDSEGAEAGSAWLPRESATQAPLTTDNDHAHEAGPVREVGLEGP
jgi:hypothetical protein